MKIINRLTSDRKTELSIAIVLLAIAISGILVNLGFLATAIANREELIYAIDNNNELLLYVGYLSLYLSTLIDTDRYTDKLRSMILGIISLSISFTATSVIHGFALKNIYLLVIIVLFISIAIAKNSLIPKPIIKLVLYGLYLISFVLIAIDILSPHKIIMGWLFR